MNTVYLDNNATTPLHADVKKAIIDFLDTYGNPSSIHEPGRIAFHKLDEALNEISEFFGAPKDDFLITSCASESNNTILKQLFFKKYDFKPHMITTAIEHPSIIETATFMSKKGVDVTFLPVNEDGIISLDDLKKNIRKETVLISIMWANNEIGSIQPLHEIGKIAQEHGIFFHTDAVQAPGRIKFKLSDLPVDSASFSAHKMYAPKGVGLLYIKGLDRKRYHYIPLIHGGHQAKGLRAGTENTIGIVALGAACKVLKNDLDNEIKHIKDLRDYFESRLKESISNIVINAEHADRKPCTSNVTFKFIEGESIVLRLDLHGICVSTGSACSTGSLDPSHVIMAICNDKERAHGSIRFSFARHNTREQVDYVIEKLKKEISFLRSISPLYRDNQLLSQGIK